MLVSIMSHPIVDHNLQPHPAVTPLLNHSLLPITGAGIRSFGLQVSPVQYASSHTDQFTYQFIFDYMRSHTYTNFGLYTQL
jgi:hypothetical protein